MNAHRLRLFLVLTSVTTLGSWLLLAGAVPSQAPADASFSLKEVGPKVWAAIANPKAVQSPAGANAGFVIGDDAVVVIDTFASPQAAEHLLAEIRQRTELPVRFAVNTHYHLDHVAGNGVFRDAGATVWAHRNVRDWIRPENAKFFGKAITPDQRRLIDGLVPPFVLYEHAIDLYLGSRHVRVLTFPGHTGGDSVVLIPDAKVGFAGDLFWRNALPNTIDASTAPWIQTLEAIAQQAAGYTLVPGHGESGTVEDLNAFRTYLATLRRLVAEAQTKGVSAQDIVSAVRPQLDATYGQWDFFQYLVEPNIRETDAELRGTKRIPRPPPKQ
jgi:cyclase